MAAVSPGLPSSRLGHEPGFWLARFGWLRRRGYKNTPPPATLGLAPVWTLFGDVTTGQAFVTDSLRALLATAPKGECWHLGAGYVACIFHHRLNGQNLCLFYERGLAVLKMNEVTQVAS